MVRTTGVQIGLLAFAIAVIAGVYAGNSATVILLRALLAMALGVVVGQAAGWTAKLVLRDHLQRRKLAIDHQHFEAIRTMTQASAKPPNIAVAQAEAEQVE
jgi:hypothetical protein